MCVLLLLKNTPVSHLVAIKSFKCLVKINKYIAITVSCIPFIQCSCGLSVAIKKTHLLKLLLNKLFLNIFAKLN